VTDRKHLLNSPAVQAMACTALGSTMYGELLDRVSADVSAGGVFADVLSGHENDPGPSAVALRLLGGLHRLVLDGRAPALRRWYPSVGGRWDLLAAWSDIAATARAHADALHLALDRAPQTNEVGRSAALVGGLLALTAEYPHPVRLFEIGASAGLNLRADRYLYLHPGGQWGLADSPVVIDDAWHGRVPSNREVRISERTGYDISPIDPRSRDGELTLLSYVWPDMADRLTRLNAVLLGDPIVMADGRIGHAEIAIGAGVLYLADETPELGLKAPATQAVSVSLMLHVPDAGRVLEKARGRGALVQREIYENYGSRNATIIDPFGHRWMISGPLRGSISRIQHGDIGYVSVCTPDAERAAAFYGHVLGWTYDPSTHRVTNTAEHIGISAVDDHPTMFCCYAVDDLAAARQAILDAGGRAGEAREFDFGSAFDATDPLGTVLSVFQPVGDQPRPLLNGGGPGELSYVTYEVTDSARFREFYGRVLHWSFEPARIADGWQITGTHPMAGVAGGSDRVTTVPMWTVADIEEAVARVRAAGGTVIQEPSAQPYGQTAECADDQAGRFYLGEF